MDSQKFDFSNIISLNWDKDLPQATLPSLWPLDFDKIFSKNLYASVFQIHYTIFIQEK